MVAVAWTAIGLLAATLLGALFYLGSKIDGVRSELGARIDAQTARIDAQTARIDALANRLAIHVEQHRA